MAVEECALCGGEMEEEELAEERETKIRDSASHLEEDDLHALVCRDCGHVSYRRS